MSTRPQAPTTARYAKPTYTPLDTSLSAWQGSAYNTDPGAYSGTYDRQDVYNVDQNDAAKIQSGDLDEWGISAGGPLMDYYNWYKGTTAQNAADQSAYDSALGAWNQNQSAWDDYNRASAGYDQWEAQNRAFSHLGQQNAANQSAMDSARRRAERGSKYKGGRALYSGMMGGI